MNLFSLYKQRIHFLMLYYTVTYHHWHALCFVVTNKNTPAMKTKATTKIRAIAGIVLFVMALSASLSQAQVFANALAFSETEDLLTPPKSSQTQAETKGDETLLLDDWMYEDTFWQLPPVEPIPVEPWMFDSNFGTSKQLFEWMTVPEDEALNLESWMFTMTLQENTILAFQATLQSWVKKREFQVL
jgi:hypothetical protein